MEQLLSAVEIAEDRAIAEAQMIDVIEISKPATAGPPVLDEATGQYPVVERVVVYGPGAVDDTTGVPITTATALGRAILSGRYRIQVRSDINSNVVEAVVAEHEWLYRTATLQLPILGTGHIRSDYVGRIITCTFDPELVGHVFNVQAETKGKTHATHRRYRIRELMG